MNALVAGWRGRSLAEVSADEMYDRDARDAELAYFDATIGRESCETPENCALHVWERCGQRRPDVLRDLKNERHRRADPLGYAAAEAARQAALERRIFARREKAAALKVERKQKRTDEKERKHLEAIAAAKRAREHADDRPDATLPTGMSETGEKPPQDAQKADCEDSEPDSLEAALGPIPDGIADVTWRRHE